MGRNMRTLGKKKGFIAAPLIGSIIFITAILFTANLNRIETADTSRTVNDAYHNRITSLIEIYRTDLNSVFRETLRRNIEEFILRPGWLTFALTNKNDFNAYISYKETREKRCKAIKDVSLDMICSIGRTSASTEATRNSFGHGIPAWITVVNQPFNFEGILFTPANEVQTRLLNPDPADSTALAAYSNACRKLVKESSFDCTRFADPGVNPERYRCLDANGILVPGCEGGTFFVRIEPTNDPQVYEALPRIVGDDGFGNTVRSGAIAEKTIFLPINIRVHKYDDIALEFYKGLAYGPIEKRNDGIRDGIVDGLCYGSPGFCRDEINKKNRGNGKPFLARDAFRRQVANDFRSGALKAAQDNVEHLVPQFLRRAEKLEMKMLLRTIDTERCDSADPQCKDAFRLNTDDLMGPHGLAPPSVDTDTPGSTTGTVQGGLAFRGTTATFFIIDDKPAFRVRGQSPNQVTYTFNMEPDNQMR